MRETRYQRSKSTIPCACPQYIRKICHHHCSSGQKGSLHRVHTPNLKTLIIRTLDVWYLLEFLIFFCVYNRKKKSNNDYLDFEEIGRTKNHFVSKFDVEPSNEGCVTHVQNSTIKTLPSDLLLHIVWYLTEHQGLPGYS